jgi:hypothetical protein
MFSDRFYIHEILGLGIYLFENIGRILDGCFGEKIWLWLFKPSYWEIIVVFGDDNSRFRCRLFTHDMEILSSSLWSIERFVKWNEFGWLNIKLNDFIE